MRAGNCAVTAALVVRGGSVISSSFRLGVGEPHRNRRKATMDGTVKFFNTAKGFGFIQPDDGGKDIFVHATALEAAGIRSLNEGDRVSFVPEYDRRGRGKQAGQLKKL